MPYRTLAKIEPSCEPRRWSDILPGQTWGFRIQRTNTLVTVKVTNVADGCVYYHYNEREDFRHHLNEKSFRRSVEVTNYNNDDYYNDYKDFQCRLNVEKFREIYERLS